MARSDSPVSACPCFPGASPSPSSAAQSQQVLWRGSILLGLLIALGLGNVSGCACGPLPGPPDAGPPFVDGIVDHTQGSIASREEFEEIAAAGASSTAAKFVMTRFNQPRQRLRWMDSRFYGLHDEWYWFRLLNGAAIDGLPDQPIDVGRSFATIAEIVTWAEARLAEGELLPLDLQFVSGGRLYSPRFYELALLNEPRSLGLGTLLHFPARDDVVPARPERWAVELEFQDAPSLPELRSIITAVQETLPGDVGPQVKWLVRSLVQEDIAQQIESSGDPLADRILRYSDVVVPGEIEVYSEGLIAGRLKTIRRGEEAELLNARPTDILVLEDTPDFLPQCAGLITAVPQYALAHVNLLARNRGIPNAYLGGALDDPNLDQLARVRAPVVVKAQAPNQLVVQAISEADFARYRALTAVPPTAVRPVDVDAIDYTYDLSTLSFSDADDLRAVIGGKNVGFLGLLEPDGVTTVDRPLGISIKAYVEHLTTTTGLQPRLAAMLNHPDFVSDPVTRRLVLEGEDAVSSGFLESWKTRHTPGDTLRDLVDDGSVMGIIRDTPLAEGASHAIRAALEVHFGRYADAQGLRFRSSSNVEDIEGFNGAGLYTSNTGFLHAERLQDPEDRARTVETAVQETWASYWGTEAFEERRQANVDHLSGSMGVVAHARFDDEEEAGNGVFLFTILPPGHPDGRFVMELNAQEGALSVTNPPPGNPHLPEVDRLVEAADGTRALSRLRGSTLLPAGAFVLQDAQLHALFEEARTVTEHWLQTDNGPLPASQRRGTLTLDFEFREVHPGWPALRTGEVFAARVVVKQARTLEPGLSRVPDSVLSLPFPRDVLARARRVEQHTCTGNRVAIFVDEAITDPRKVPDVGFAVVPFTAFFVVNFLVDVPELEGTASTGRSVVHTAFAAIEHPGMAQGGPWAVAMMADPARAEELGLSRIAIDPQASGGPTATVESLSGAITENVSCERTLLHASPEDFLDGLL